MNVDIENAEGLSPEEELYTATKLVYDSMSCMTVTEEKVKIYRSLAEKFKSIEDYQDAKELAAQCEKLAEETHILVCDTKLQLAEEYMANTKNTNELKKAERLLKEIKDYKNADELHKQCKAAYDRIINKRKHRLYAFYGVVVLAVILFIFSRTSICKYESAKLLEKAGHYSMAGKIFDGLNDYKDSEDHLVKCRYEAGKEIMAKENLGLKDYQKAKDTFVKTDGYEDSNQWIADVEKGLIQCKEIGDKITFNKSKWIVADKVDGKALIVKVDGIEELPYSNHDREVTWDSSYLRQYLNTTFLEENFTKEEQNNIVDTKLKNESSPEYGTTGGSDTIDKIFILSIKEQMKYAELLHVQAGNSWLRTPGVTEKTVAFMNAEGGIMEYGYVADSMEMLTVPAFWYEY